MEIIIAMFLGLAALGFFVSVIEFIVKRRLTTVFMMLLAFLVSPNGYYLWTALSFILLSWLFTSKDGLIGLAIFTIGFMRNK